MGGQRSILYVHTEYVLRMTSNNKRTKGRFSIVFAIISGITNCTFTSTLTTYST